VEMQEAKKNKKCRNGINRSKKEKYRKQRETSEMQEIHVCEKDWEDKLRIKQI
jgi:hypothetical protein